MENSTRLNMASSYGFTKRKTPYLTGSSFLLTGVMKYLNLIPINIGTSRPVRSSSSMMIAGLQDTTAMRLSSVAMRLTTLP